MGRFFIIKKNRIKEYLYISLGTFLMSVAVVTYFDVIGIVSGGATGTGIILHDLFGVPLWFVNVAVNIPLFIAGFRILDIETFIRTLYATISLTLMLGIVPRFNILTGDKVVDVIFGSILMGAGMGLIFSSYSSSGGSDMLATLINKKVKYISIPWITAAIDGIVVIAGAGVFGLRNGIYSLIAVYVIARVSDTVVEGPNHAKVMYIITKDNKKLAEYIEEQIERGVTYIETTGAFTGTQRKMIMCVASSKEMVKIKQKTYEIDDNAIFFVGDIREAFGEGFTKFRG
ncbi:MAG: YitT family protein [Wujia sp.]